MDVMDAIRTRRSVRRYSPSPIPAEIMKTLKDALRLAPSACNNQPWKFILVTDAALRRSVAEASRNQVFMADAPVIVVGVGFPEMAYRHMGGYDNSVEVDVAIALDHLTLAAAAHGIGSCWIGAFSEEKLKKLLNIPHAAKIVALIPLGYPASPDLLHPQPEDARKTEEQVFVMERYA